MARRISRKELKHDEFVDAAVGLGHWLEENWRTAVTWAAAGLVVVLAVVGWFVLAQYNRGKAELRLAGALQAYEEVEAEGFADSDRLNELLTTFDEVSDGAGGSRAGAVARFYKGSVLYRLGRADEAIPVLERVVEEAEGTTLEATASSMLANVYQAGGRDEDAISLLNGLVDQADPSVPLDQALLQLGIIYDEAGRTEEAREQWQRILDEYPTSGAANMARQYLNS
jgi:tetratricopeptide (TPR) repeat protein